MSLTSETMTPADIAAITGSGSDGFGSGNGAWWLIVLFLFIFAGGWGNGFGNSTNSGAAENYVLSSDFATLQRMISDGNDMIERKLDNQNAGICDLGYTQAQLINGVNSNVSSVGYNTINAIQQNGYESRLATQTIGSQMQECCCGTKQQIAETNYNLATQANGINRAIENGFSQTNYNLATQNCATLQAIEKVGDRVIDYIAADKMQTLRDENAALRLAASQAAQNNYLIDALRPSPVPAYISCNPYSTTSGCGCA